MRESDAYKILQEIVVNTPVLRAEDKINIMRLLFEQEDLALYREEHEKQEEKENESV